MGWIISLDIFCEPVPSSVLSVLSCDSLPARGKFPEYLLHQWHRDRISRLWEHSSSKIVSPSFIMNFQVAPPCGYAKGIHSYKEFYLPVSDDISSKKLPSIICVNFNMWERICKLPCILKMCQIGRIISVKILSGDTPQFLNLWAEMNWYLTRSERIWIWDNWCCKIQGGCFNRSRDLAALLRCAVPSHSQW